MYQLEIKFVGRVAEPVRVWDSNGTKLPAMFTTVQDAEQAKMIVEKYNSNSAFEYCVVV